MKRENEQVPAIQVDDVWVRYDQRIVLEAIHLDVKPREIVSIVGPNGSGKTTLLRTILGFKQPFRGRVSLFGAPVGPGKLPCTVGYLPQINPMDRHFPFHVSHVVAQPLFARKSLLTGLNDGERGRIQQLLERVEMAGHISDHFGSLSECQKQRVLIARALVMRPSILILDEPSTGLDAVSQDRFYNLLCELRSEEALTILMVSHDIGVVSGIVDRVACLNRRIHFHGKPSDCIPSDALQQVFGEHVQFVYHSPHCKTCEKAQ